jgi:hypothetical protein
MSGEPPKVLLAEMTSLELEEALRRTDTTIIPLGSTKVLGRHGPLGADHLIAAEVGRRLGEEADCIVAPPVPYGDALEMRHWPGVVKSPTVTISRPLRYSFDLRNSSMLVEKNRQIALTPGLNMVKWSTVESLGNSQ